MAASLVVVCEAGVEWLTNDEDRLMPTGREEWARAHEVSRSQATQKANFEALEAKVDEKPE
ncbi:ATP-binding protein [Apiospora arundinis]|uniref:ATP-binding protein n=1 Tax=Apiospora arundinis TaxID=335852 RepID=A0ABR2IH20_9PEZI